jgi:hypothetical protein
MFNAQLNLPSLMKWQSRLAHVPRWAWIAFLVPLAVLFALAIVVGLIALAAVLIVGAIFGLVKRLLLPRPRSRSRGEIVVRDVRIVDP